MLQAMAAAQSRKPESVISRPTARRDARRVSGRASGSAAAAAATRSSPPTMAATMASSPRPASAQPPAVEARMKATEPQTRIRP